MEDQSRELIFALDIGTRSIIGIAGRQQGDLFIVEASEQVEHPKRAMIDGQIEDIGQVAKVAEEVKNRLEEQLGTRLQRVAVAAAGRALKTCNATFKTELPGTPITPQLVYELENSAVNEARHHLDRGDDNTQYYCVGHSVVRYAVDGYPFTTLIDHNGSEVEVEIIATFLPTEVVTSLRRCMELIGLDIDILTLEPIAAMRAVLPADVRLLNLAMVDIGAGTADIALTRDGTVSGYTMATVAGDEITEAIIRKCLVDFETAETIKLSLLDEEEVHYKDILGHEQNMPTKDILASIEVSVEMLAKVISDRIEEANGGPPMAVFLVGGGSRTPSLCEKVAEKLALEPDKVAVAGTNFSGRILNEEAGLDSPEYATPVGIALTAADEESSGGASVEINGKRVRLYTSEASSVMDALLIGGYTYSDLMGRNGRSVTFTLNGERKVVRGGQYSVAEISLNGKPAGLTSPVQNGDTIEIVPATSGEDADPHISDFANGAVPLAVTLNGSGVRAGLLAFLNGTPVTPETPIGELDDVEISEIATVGDLCRNYGVSTDLPSLTRNGNPTAADTELRQGDAISTRQASSEPEPAEPKPEIPPAVETQTASEATESPVSALQNIDTNTASPPPEEQDVAENTAASVDREAPSQGTPEETAAGLSVGEDGNPQENMEQAGDTSPAAASETAQAPSNTLSPPSMPLETPDDTDIMEADAHPLTDSTNEGEGATTSELPTEKAPAEEELPVQEEEAKPPPMDSASREDEETSEPATTAIDPPENEAQEVLENTENEEEREAAPDPEPPRERESTTPVPEIQQTNSLPGSSLRIELNGRMVVLPPKAGGSSHFLLDMLPLVDIDPNNPRGKVLIRRNGAEAAYLDELVSGDSVEIRWEEDL
ncbi:pilus assembly protein PilM [Ruminococcaceae bacterium OttesenSCG-928-I18]|nr:pilus assembly protein PilM [Ruminococcaceae bacterium OttesenSCG-928-I18]